MGDFRGYSSEPWVIYRAAVVHPGGFSGLECEECQYFGLDLPSLLGARTCTLLLEEKNSTLKFSQCGVGHRSGMRDSYCVVCRI